MLPDSGPCGYICIFVYLYNYMSAERMWVGLPRGAVRTIKKKTMRLPGRAWPLQHFLRSSTEIARAYGKPFVTKLIEASVIT